MSGLRTADVLAKREGMVANAGEMFPMKFSPDWLVVVLDSGDGPKPLNVSTRARME